MRVFRASAWIDPSSKYVLDRCVDQPVLLDAREAGELRRDDLGGQVVAAALVHTTAVDPGSAVSIISAYSVTSGMPAG